MVGTLPSGQEDKIRQELAGREPEKGGLKLGVVIHRLDFQKMGNKHVTYAAARVSNETEVNLQQ